MRRFSAWTFGLFATAVVLGCGPNKELPTVVPTVKGSGPKQAPPPPKVPATSEPAAKAVIDKAIAALTQNNPKLLSKGRVSRCLTRGAVQLPTGGPMTEANRRIEAAWPDRSRVVYEFKGAVLPPRTFVLRWPLGTLFEAEKKVERATPEELGTILRDDLLGQHWLPLGVSLDDPRAVVFDAQARSIAGRAATNVKFALPGHLVYELTFDDQSGLLIRVEYTAKELNGLTRKMMVLSEHKATGGLMLPHALETTQHGQFVERWGVDTWEFPEKLDDTTFDVPK